MIGHKARERRAEYRSVMKQAKALDRKEALARGEQPGRKGSSAVRFGANMLAVWIGLIGFVIFGVIAVIVILTLV